MKLFNCFNTKLTQKGALESEAKLYTADTTRNERIYDMSVAHWEKHLLWFLFNPRIYLSPFTKDFRGEEHYNESID